MEHGMAEGLLGGVLGGRTRSAVEAPDKLAGCRGIQSAAHRPCGSRSPSWCGCAGNPRRLRCCSL